MLAFKGAKGFGAQAQGGRGGEVVKVTNLNDSGEGSLRWALEDLDQKRIVVFDVGGQIDLKDQIEINGNVTLAGQTAPGGVTVTGGRLRVVDSDVIIRGMHVRPGDEAGGDDPGNRDGIAVGKRGQTVDNVMIDSNSISWSVDELASTWGAPSNVTFSNNIMAEALQNSIHPKGDHSMGLLIGDNSKNISVVGNLIANTEFRNATIKDDAKQIEFINNVVSNYGPNGLAIHEGTTANVISNIYAPGKDSAGREAIRLLSPEESTAYFLKDNDAEVAGAAMSKIKDGYVFAPRTTDVVSSKDLFDHVLANVGARGQGLDAIDARIIEGVRNGTGKIIDSPNEVGGYEDGRLRKGLRDSDDDGIPDEYETLIGSNPNRADAQGDADKDGYANIENYINGLLDGFGDDAPKGGVTSQPEITLDPTPPVESPSTPTAPETGEVASVAPNITIEAETLKLSEGFSIDSLSAASGNSVIRARSDAAQEAKLQFDGDTGRYDLTLNYFDEADGNSTMAVLVNGQQVTEWTWDKDLGDNKANSNTRTSKVIEDIELAKGDTVTLRGTRDGSEPLRIDNLRFTQSGGSTETARETASVEDGATSAPAAPLHLEVDEFELTGFRVDDLGAGSGGTIIRRDGKGEHSAATTFEGADGTYDIALNYFDENDGESSFMFKLNGVELASWVWDEDLGHSVANKDTLTQHVIEDVRLEKGDRLVLIGEDDGGEPLRVDSLDFTPNDLLVA